jgi:hypothetical protein
LVSRRIIRRNRHPQNAIKLQTFSRPFASTDAVLQREFIAIKSQHSIWARFTEGKDYPSHPGRFLSFKSVC